MKSDTQPTDLSRISESIFSLRTSKFFIIDPDTHTHTNTHLNSAPTAPLLHLHASLVILSFPPFPGSESWLTHVLSLAHVGRLLTNLQTGYAFLHFSQLCSFCLWPRRFKIHPGLSLKLTMHLFVLWVLSKVT